MKFRLSELSVGQYLGWIWASAVYGLCVLYVASKSGSLESPDHLVPTAIFIFCWLAGVGLLRIYVQDKDPMDFKDLLGLKRKK